PGSVVRISSLPAGRGEDRSTEWSPPKKSLVRPRKPGDCLESGEPGTPLRPQTDSARTAPSLQFVWSHFRSKRARQSARIDSGHQTRALAGPKQAAASARLPVQKEL